MELIKTVENVYLRLTRVSGIYIVSLSILFSIGLSLRLWKINSLGLFYDEAHFAYIASDILRGKIIYKDIVDSKMPYFYYTIATMFLLFGNSIIYPRLLTAFLSTFTLVFVYSIGKTLYNKNVGLISAGIYVLDPLSIFWSRYVMTEPYMTFFATFALYAYILHRNSKKKAFLFLAGVFAGVSFFMKQPGIIVFFVITICISIDSFRKDTSHKVETIITQVLILLLGIITAIVPGVSYLLLHNAFGDFIQWSFLAIRVFKIPILTRFIVLYVVLNYNVLIWTLGLGGILFTSKRRNRSDLIALSFFLIPCAILVSLSSFYDHYFLQVIPFLSILSAVFLMKLLQFTTRLPMKEFPYGRTILSGIIIATILVPYAHSFPLIFYSYAGEPLFDPNKSLIEEKKVGYYLETHTSTGEKIFAFDPKYIFLANRETLCKYIYITDWYILGSPNRATILNEVFDTLVSSKVNYAVFENSIEDLQQRYSLPDTLRIINYIQENYILEKTISQAFIYRYTGSGLN